MLRTKGWKGRAGGALRNYSVERREECLAYATPQNSKIDGKPYGGERRRSHKNGKLFRETRRSYVDVKLIHM